MTREEAKEDILRISNANILLELPTSYGKTKCALDILHNRNPQGKILIVIPRLVLINNWKDEITKWGYNEYLSRITFSTYISLPKHAGKWDFVIFDEAHHLSERCQEALKEFEISNCVLLSATIQKAMKGDLKYLFKDLYCYKVNLKEAIDSEVLPDPRVYLIPISLDTKKENCLIVKNPKGKLPAIQVDYWHRWDAIKTNKSFNLKKRIEITCTQAQYITELDKEINFWKNTFIRSRNNMAKNKWLHNCGERLKWLSEQKNSVVLKILEILKDERTLTFCNSVEQTELLGEYSINSKDNNIANSNLAMFNAGKINHLTACRMLNEGMNLVNCRVGVYANLNSSDIIILQRLGRILRHEKPVIVIPYFKGTREEELVDMMLENYNAELVTTVNLKDFKI